MADKLSSPEACPLVNAKGQEEEQAMALIVGDDLSSHVGSGRLIGSRPVKIAKTGRLLSAQELTEKYGWKPVATEERMENLRSNLEFFV